MDMQTALHALLRLAKAKGPDARAAAMAGAADVLDGAGWTESARTVRDAIESPDRVQIAARRKGDSLWHLVAGGRAYREQEANRLAYHLESQGTAIRFLPVT